MNKIELFLIPCGKENLFLPAKRVDNVFPFANPIPTTYNNECLVGAFIYKDEKVPILDLTVAVPQLVADDKSTKTISRRLVVVSAFTADSPFKHYAILATGMPRAIDVEKDYIKEADNNDIKDVFFSKINIVKEYAAQIGYVPDLEYIEKNLLN